MSTTRSAGPTTPAPGGQRPGSSRKAVGLMTALVLLMIGTGTLAAFLLKGSPAPPTPQQLAKAAGSQAPPPGIGNKTLPATNAQVMGLVTVRHTHAPNFTLTGQNGHTFSLDQLDRTHAVVLAFMDDRCKDVCPLVAQELADAYHNMGSRASSVEFVSVNVNAAHNATGWLRSFITTHGLKSVPIFHYLTGSPSLLRKVWADYGITVKVDPATSAVYHSEGMYFIAPGGTEIYKATPYANLRKNGTGWLPTGTISQWGHGIAQYAEAAARASSGQH